MKTKTTVIVACGLLAAVAAATTIDPAHPYAYGANIGWVNAEGDVASGAVIGQAFCEGYMYGANVGWIHLGDGTPVNGMAYANNSASDFGINHDGLGNLTGYAYGANIGWISLSTLATLTLDSGPDSDSDGIPDSWEYGHTNVLTILANGGTDSDGDGIPDVDEYGADTDPFDGSDYLVITDFQALETTNSVTWPVKTTRLYTLQHAAALSNGLIWADTSASFIPSTSGDVTETVPGVTDPSRFYRVLVDLPLCP